MGERTHTILKARVEDTNKAAYILGDAFTHDPVMRWLLDDNRFDERFFRLELENLYMRHDHVFLNEEGTGAAAWLPPGISAKEERSLSMFWILARIVMRWGFKPLGRMQQVENMFRKHHPREDHYYLHAIGACLSHQGKGIGSALLRHGTGLCDANNAPAYLESSNEKNVPLYMNYGFKVVAEETLPDGGPTVWFMWRDARSAVR